MYNEDWDSHNVLRTGSSRQRQVQARLTVLSRLMRVSWPAISLVSSLMLKKRWGALWWIMVMHVEPPSDPVTPVKLSQRFNAGSRVKRELGQEGIQGI